MASGEYADNHPNLSKRCAYLGLSIHIAVNHNPSRGSGRTTQYAFAHYFAVRQICVSANGDWVDFVPETTRR